MCRVSSARPLLQSGGALRGVGRLPGGERGGGRGTGGGMGESVAEFYDLLSEDYHHIIRFDWKAAVREQGVVLDRFLATRLGRPSPYSVLDCSCGIGTQAIGLALHGHRVHATDLSPAAVARARREAAALGVSIAFGVADFRELDRATSDLFDVVLSCDNSIAHCLGEDDLARALASMRGRLKPGGLLVVSLRDYGQLVRDKPRFMSERVDDGAGGRRIAFQVWDWAEDGRRYRLNQFLVKERDGRYELKHFATELRALLAGELTAAVRRAGLKEVRSHMPDESGYYQPIVTGLNG